MPVKLSYVCDWLRKDISSSVKDKSHHSHTSHNYQKPGANVRLTHNYDGATNTGEVENLSLIFTEQYSSGQMYIPANLIHHLLSI